MEILVVLNLPSVGGFNPSFAHVTFSVSMFGDFVTRESIFPWKISACVVHLREYCTPNQKLTCFVLLSQNSHLFKGALDKYNIIPQLFPKKVEIFIPSEVLA